MSNVRPIDTLTNLKLMSFSKHCRTFVVRDGLSSMVEESQDPNVENPVNYQ